jgi:thiol:disulfide interchange protein
MSDKKPYRPLMFVLAIALGMVVFAGIRKAMEGKEAIRWRTSLAKAREESAASRKPVLAYFTATWCGPCQEMKRTTFADPRVADALEQSVVPVKIDVDEHPEIARDFRITNIPVMQIIRPDGERGPARMGFTSADELLRWLSGS